MRQKNDGRRRFSDDEVLFCFTETKQNNFLSVLFLMCGKITDIRATVLAQ